MLAKFKKIDYVIVIILILLMGISIMAVYSATFGKENDGSHIKTIYNYILGFFVFFVVSLFDYRLLVKYAVYIYLFGLMLLVITNFVGNTYYNATGWITLPGGVSFQPAEMFKLILVIFLAFVLVRKKKAQLLFWRDVVPIVVMTLIPFAAVMKQNDLGNALSYLVILVGMLWIGNLKYSHALIALIIFTASIVGGIKAYTTFHEQMYVFFKDIKREHWLERIDPWLMPEEASPKAVYHTKNAKFAIATGGMTGTGFMKGESVQAGLVPLTYSDSIFVVIAEEFGFVGCSVLLLLYFTLIHRLILISLESKDRAGPFIVVGIVAMLLYQIFENIGMFIGLMPLTGITLPFISYGGTSLLINMASMGVAISIGIHSQQEEEDMPNPSSRYALKKRV